MTLHKKKYTFLILPICAYILFGFTGSVLADSFTRTAGDEITNPVSLSATIDDFTATFGVTPSVGAVWGYYISSSNTTRDEQIFTDELSDKCVPVTQNTLNISVTLPVDVFYDDIFAVVFDDGNCDTNSWTYDVYLQRNSIDGLGFTVIEGSTNTTWGSNYGFWGDIEPSEITGSMVASVQETGANLWPMFALVGVPIAFLIGLAMVNFIATATDQDKKLPKFNDKMADDLENFYSKRGKTSAKYNYDSINPKT